VIIKNKVKTCEKCKIEFKGRKKQRFCSLKCHKESCRIEKICKKCKCFFIVRKSISLKSEYCSKECRSKKIKKICKHCKNEFTVTDCNKKKEYCTKKCLLDYENERKRKFNCAVCGKECLAPPNNVSAKYCSNKCRFSVGKVKIVCCKCGKVVTKCNWQIKGKKKYCSTKCFMEREDEIITKCDGCKKEIRIFPSQKKYYKKHYCSNKCRFEFGPCKQITKSLNFNKNYQKFVRKVRHCVLYFDWRDKIRERDKNKCVKCGCEKDLTVHHRYVTMYDFVKKYGFNKEGIYSDNMFFDVNNGETLCRSCHAKEHGNS